MKKRTFAIWRAVAAVVIAAALLVGTGFAFGRLIGGPETVTDGAELKNGAYIKAELAYIMDIFGVDRGASGRVTAYYAVAPIGNQFVVIRFPVSDIDNPTELEARTTAFLKGEETSIGFGLAVTGMVSNLSEDTAALFAGWFNENAGWMSQSGVISEVNNYGDYLSGMMIDSGRVGNVSYGAAIGLNIAAAVLLVYAAAELTLVGVGVYGQPSGRKRGHG